MVLGSLNYAGHVTRQREAEQKRIDAKKAAAKKAEKERNASEARYTTPAREQGTQTAPPSASYEESLG